MKTSRTSKTAPTEENPYAGRAILVVNTGWIKKKFIFQKLKRLGLTVVVLHKEKNWADPYVDHWIIADTANHSESLGAVKSFINKHPRLRLEGAITFWEDDVLITSKIIDRFNFIGIPYEIAKNVRNKFRFREFCRENNLPTPRHRLIKSEKDLKAVVSEFTFPVVIKPAYGASSTFVIKIERKEDLPDVFEYVRSNISIDILSSLTDGLDILVEEYIDGDEVDVDVLLQNGKIKFFSISDNFDKTKDMFFIDRGQSLPSGLPLGTQTALLTMVEEVLEKLGIQNGCIHFEAKATKNGPVPIEVNLRMGGDYIYSYTKDAWGVDLIEHIVEIAMGEYLKPITIDRPKRYVIGWDLHPEVSGILVELTVDEALKSKPYVEEIHIDKQIGDSVLVPPEGYEYMGWITVSGDNMLDAQDNLRHALQHIHYNVVPFEKESVLGRTSRENRFTSAVLDAQAFVGAAKIGKFWVLPPTGQRNLHIGILGNRFLDMKHADPAKRASTQMGYDIEQSLTKIGYQVTFYNANNMGRVVESLQHNETDIMFNLCHAIHNTKRLGASAASLLDIFQVPYIGSDAFVRTLSLNKILTKKLLAFHKIPMPGWDYLYTPDAPVDETLEFPLIIKPALPLDSADVDMDVVVRNRTELREKSEAILHATGQPVIIEEFIAGQEYDIFILGNDDENLRVLPIVKAAGRRGSKKSTPSISSKLQTVMTEIALDTYNRLSCQDYGQVRIRVDKDANPYVIGVDTNPNIGATSSFATVAKKAGIDYHHLLEEIIHLAIRRYKETHHHRFPLLDGPEQAAQKSHT